MNGDYTYEMISYICETGCRPFAESLMINNNYLMNLTRLIGTATLSALLFSSCSNDIKILAPYKDISVVYGLMDQSDSIHYFRINKAFEGAGNAYTMAQVYDSIYYPVANISAYLQDSDGVAGKVVNSYKLDTITTIPLPVGTFPTKQLLYYTTAGGNKLNPNDYYNLVITNTKTGKKITGSTTLLPDLSFTSPLNFAHSATLTISFDPQYPTTVGWNSSVNGRIYQMDIQFHYVEVNSSNDSAHYSIDWLFAPQTASSLAGGIYLSYTLTAKDLYSLLLHEIQPKLGITRHVDYLEVIFTTGSDDLNTYVQLSQPSLTINQDVPSFTDVKNGIGLFTSRHIQYIRKGLGAANIDSLVKEPQYQSLKFQY